MDDALQFQQVAWFNDPQRKTNKQHQGFEISVTTYVYL